MDTYVLEHLAARRVLQARGVDPEHATEQQYLSAAETVLAATATAATRDPTIDDAVNARTLAVLNIKDGRRVADVGVTEAEFLAEAIRQEQLLDLELGAATRERPAAVAGGDSSEFRTATLGLPVGVIAAEDRDVYCAECGHVHAGWKECPQR